MNESIITVRYAKAFFSLAKEKGMLDTLKADIETVMNVCNESVDFILFLDSPVVKTSKKIKLFTEIFSGSVHELTLKFLILIAENKRESYIPGVCRNFLGLTRENMGIKSAVMTTATELSEATTEKVKQILEKELKSKIELSGRVNPEILGGMILRIEDKQFDASLATQLKKVKTALLETEIK
ncbi:MAG: ATP synthase F1 subunit delta [Prolixibacteraceae bacterium]|nr:ATP synthase F1 subunit delta [Prolixibacteraceae bacterium]MBN2773854.1 ATP synthase F1 subunit delta [Prolixibacteraceae bacterium]